MCHLDATCEGRDSPADEFIDSLSQIVLGNVKLPAEDEKHIVPFLQHIKETFGIPLAPGHDMAVASSRPSPRSFPVCPDFICHFHFLRDIGKDLLAKPYDMIARGSQRRSRSARNWRYRAKQLKETT